ncbi:MAG TPA: LysM peptidoglycan-binding domain-containing protein, partial [Flavobacteriaceae bacterium]|nr:LysM peptidoglycan-binding domain-containing protein [Flavobacteriaceae bacterium]
IPEYKIVKEVVVTTSPLTTYTVQPKEGKWRIAYKYGVTVQELEDLNPDMKDVLQPGDVVNVPNKDAETIKEVDEKYSYYTVLPKEGFYRIKLKTGLSQEELEQLNPELVETGLKEGMVLKIPFKSENSTIEGVVSSMTTNTGKVDLTKSDIDTETKKIAIMLPFGLNKVDTDSIYDTKKQIETDRYLSVSLDFYTGVRVALDSLQDLGVNLKVDVFDTQNRESEVASILRSNDFSETSAVIGPLMPKLFNDVASRLKNDNVPIISPLTKTVDLGDNVFQSRPSEDMLEDAVINYFKKDSTAHVIIISDRKHKTVSDKLKREFTRASVLSSRTERKTGKDAYYVLDLDIVNVLKPGKNVVFLETDNPGFVSNVSSLLNSKIVTGTDIILTTTKMDKAFEDEEVRNTHLSNLNFTYSDIKKSYNEDENNSFAKRYMSTYNELPNSYAVRGFDITMDVVLRLVTSEDLYLSANLSPLTSYVENKFAYKKKLFGGYY